VEPGSLATAVVASAAAIGEQLDPFEVVGRFTIAEPRSARRQRG
jgi:hypothetical protein